MSYKRLTSLDPVELEGWRWAPFLNEIIHSFSSLQPTISPIAADFLNKESTFGSKIKPQKVQTQTWACRTNKLRHVRAACVEASGTASVLNFLVHPLESYDLPFFGADFVTLSSGHLLALDLQPVIKSDKLHTQAVWRDLLPMHARWQSILPPGGPIPKEAEPYFSPGFLWTRLPLGLEADRIISEVIMPAFKDYFSLYLNLVNNAIEVTKGRSSDLLLGQESYMRYRAEKDPARRMLTSFFGKEWTEFYIHDVLFDLSEEK
ncbi:phycoerythrobilin:ferredoxin oxidoreductase [Prochlorococcus sp. MIT 1307]|uniref:phycoerythrobilin:ferredoxin oxidoreductase n=1 Tax=Prochlorococcus sp. MIT 1307 TaxID=3096219 RepID=UPI002A74D84A|nr:phycoerythrobilin:ferredoxin oxidoreductase [Prochlorococcus sp. MIT 1307]